LKNIDVATLGKNLIFSANLETIDNRHQWNTCEICKILNYTGVLYLCLACCSVSKLSFIRYICHNCVLSQSQNDVLNDNFNRLSKNMNLIGHDPKTHNTYSVLYYVINENEPYYSIQKLCRLNYFFKYLN